MLTKLDQQYHIKKRYPTVVWESGYDDEVFYPISENSLDKILPGLEGKFKIMFHGSLSMKRGLDMAIQALRILRDRGIDDVIIVYIGQGNAQNFLKQLVRDENLTEQVFFFPPIPHQSLPSIINCADLGMDPLPDHPWWNNQSPLKVYEYLGMGIPVLATDIPCHRNISDSVLLLSDHTPASFARKIIEYRSLTKQQKDHLRECALKDSQKYTWRARAEILAGFLHSVLDDSQQKRNVRHVS
jgi:glycosyltransferase involved in cell wall biosynthesis